MLLPFGFGFVSCVALEFVLLLLWCVVGVVDLLVRLLLL